jgi:hypothetical protein
LRKQLISGGAILREPRRFFTDLFLPELGSYAARLAIVAVFLGAYGIPVSFHNVATVTASNSISNSVSATPGGIGVTQAMNSAALSGSVDASTATAYSIGQQLIISAWDVLFAVIVVSWVFGWSGGKALVESSYEDAKTKSRELKAKRKSAEGPSGGCYLCVLWPTCVVRVTFGAPEPIFAACTLKRRVPFLSFETLTMVKVELVVFVTFSLPGG